MTLHDDILADIAKRLSDPKAIFTLHDDIEDFPTLPSGIATIDATLEGGLPQGRVIELYGPEASGKTTVMLHFIAAAQKRGDIVYFIDAEHALDHAYAARIGVKLDKLLFSQPDSGEDALETARVICESTEEMQKVHGGAVRTLIVIDSVPALVPKETFETFEKDGYDATQRLGASARMLAKLLPPLVAKASKANVTVVFINQERDNIGVTYGSPTTTPGGRAMKYFTSMRLAIRRGGYFDVGGKRAGIRSRLIPTKSKLFPVFGREAAFIITENGINVEAAIAEQAIEKKIFTKAGAWVKMGDRSFQGIAKLEEALREDAEFKAEVEALLGTSDADAKASLKEAMSAKRK